MLIRFRVSNFRSLRDEQELSMVAAFKDDDWAELVHSEGLSVDLLRVAGIYGANAAGKSNVLQALRFIREAVNDSHRRWKPDGKIPREPFLLDSRSQTEPSLFELEFLSEGTHFQYGFSLNSDKILEEWLHAYPNKRRQTWFTRTEQEFIFSKSLRGSNRTIGSLTRKNSLFLSTAAENNHPALLPIYNWISEELRFTDSKDEPARQLFSTQLAQEDKTRARLIEFLKIADLGIVGLGVRQIPVDDEMKTRVKAMLGLSSDDRESEVDAIESIPWLEFEHSANQGTVRFAFTKESRGTQAWFSLIGPIIYVLSRGGVLCVDELDSSLHSRLAFEVIKTFQSPETNPLRAQLIFNTHDTTLLGNLLDQPGLRRDQIWFVEKDENGATQLYPLTDFKPRKHENLERGYLQGRYGAIPFISPVLVGEDG